jgi:hypothetical protein
VKGTGGRDYDFGPGVGGTLTAEIEHSGTPHLIVQYQPAYVHFPEIRIFAAYKTAHKAAAEQ